MRNRSTEHLWYFPYLRATNIPHDDSRQDTKNSLPPFAQRYKCLETIAFSSNIILWQSSQPVYFTVSANDPSSSSSPMAVNKYREKGCNNCEISVGRLACTTVSRICTVSSRGRRRQPSSSPLPHRFTPTWWPVAARPLSFRSQPDARCIVARIPKCYVLFHFQLLAGPQEWLGNLLSRWTGPRDRIIAIDPVR